MTHRFPILPEGSPELLPEVAGCRSARLGSCVVSETTSSSYRPRTIQNARNADITAAFALNFSSGGEILTASAAGGKLAPYSMLIDPLEAGDRLAERLRSASARSLNVAGNSLHTLSKRGMSQSEADLWIFRCLSRALEAHPVELILSGGQTGSDHAGAAVSMALGIPSRITYPSRFLRRGADGFDFASDPIDVLLSIRESASFMLASTLDAAADAAASAPPAP